MINERSQDIHDDIVFQCLTTLSRRLPWTKYNQLFISFFRQLKATSRNLNLVQRRYLTRTISAIIDAFHFQVTDDPNQGEGQRITRAIQQRLLPMILDVLSQKSFSIDTLTSSGTGTKNATIDEQRQQALLLTVTCALIATKLLVVFSPDYVKQHISTILRHLISLLRSRLYSIRDQARDCLYRCTSILGKRFFNYFVEEMIAGLHQGYQHFVFLHTIHTLLIHISSMLRRRNRRRQMNTRAPRTNHRVFPKQRQTKQWMWWSYSVDCFNPTMNFSFASNNDSRQIFKSETLGSGRGRWLTTEHSLFFFYPSQLPGASGGRPRWLRRKKQKKENGQSKQYWMRIYIRRQGQSERDSDESIHCVWRCSWFSIDWDTVVSPLHRWSVCIHRPQWSMDTSLSGTGFLSSSQLVTHVLWSVSSTAPDPTVEQHRDVSHRSNWLTSSTDAMALFAPSD